MVVLPQTHCLIFVLLLLTSCKPGGPIVVVYASQDQVYAEPILDQFSRETGVRVRAVYDSEAVKTVGLVNRLLVEARKPRCDVFWNNEELRTRQLEARQAVSAWVAVGFRSRRVVINTNLLQVVPQSLLELTNLAWKGKVALAYPLFGTTATHFLALRQHWGKHGWEQWCRALAANHPFLVDGNSVVVQLVGRGEAAIGLTDSDDIAAGQRQGLPIAALPLSEEAFLIPNTIALIRGAPHPTEAQRLFDYLQNPEALNALVNANALEGTNKVRDGLGVNWDGLLRDLDSATATLRTIFLR